MIESKLQDVLDLLRTGTAPDAFGMTGTQWMFYKITKACGELQSILDELHDKADPPMDVDDELLG